MQGTLRGDLWLPATELLELKLAGALRASRGLRGSRSARDAASIRHVAHYFGLITLLLWARVRRMQRRSKTRLCTLRGHALHTGEVLVGVPRSLPGDKCFAIR